MLISLPSFRCSVLIRQLTKAGFTTEVASDGAEALEVLKAKAAKYSRFDVVLMDIEVRLSFSSFTMENEADFSSFASSVPSLQMPKMNGLQCIAEVRKLEEAGELSPRNLVFVRRYVLSPSFSSCSRDLLGLKLLSFPPPLVL
jgi:CheY-like chemotaxis protein